MSDAPESHPVPRRLWPLWLLGAVIVAVVLAFVWVRAEVKRVRDFQRFDYRPATVQTNDTLAGYREALSGGDAVRGRKIFFEKPEASCGRCHRVGGQGGDNGPVLDGIGSRQTREFILESMVDPNIHIPEGYTSVVVVLKSGSGISGVLRSEAESNLVIHTPDDGPVTVSKANIMRRVAAASPMPADFPTLISKAELGDLVAFLGSLTNTAPK